MSGPQKYPAIGIPAPEAHDLLADPMLELRHRLDAVADRFLRLTLLAGADIDDVADLLVLALHGVLATLNAELVHRRRRRPLPPAAAASLLYASAAAALDRRAALLERAGHG